MAYKSIVISSGHGKIVRGASGILDEVDEARKVVDEVANKLRNRGVTVETFHDNTSTTQSQNLSTITNYHNKQDRELDISVHFNAYEQVDKPMGAEVLYVTQQALAAEMSAAIAAAGEFINRGPKKRTDLAFLNNTDEPSVLLEICFVDSEADAELYRENFEAICDAIVDVVAGESQIAGMPPVEASGESITGTCSWFGGPDDDGVSPSEGLAFIYKWEDAPHLFLPYQPEGTTGLARRLNPYVAYLAMRFDYDVIPKDKLLDHVALVRNVKTGMALTAIPSDWGPHEDTRRIADLSPWLMEALGLTTDDTVEVIFPYDVDED